MSISSLHSLKGVFQRLGLILAATFVPGIAAAEYALNFQRPVTEIAGDLLELHNLITLIVTVIMIIVFCVMFYSILMHRKSRGHQAATFHDNSTLEVIWTVVPFLILVAMAIPSTATLLKMDDTSGSEMTVKITGYQWKWKYDYLDQDVSFFSSLSTPQDQINNKADKGENYLLEVDNPIVLPVGKKIRFLVTANDVIHAWWVPQLGVKKDAIPGYVNEIWTKIDEPGTYRGQCAELCGKDHGFMPIVVQAVSEDEFNKWASVQKDKMVAAQAGAGKTWTKSDLVARGEKVYGQSCAACHGPSGAGVPGVFPAMTGSKIATGPVADHLNIVMNGKAGTAMTAYKGQLNDVDLAAVITFERNGLGNNTGDVVQPSQVKALR
ncbi:MAG: cytochrome c oxidase subunit II [Gammaproteobacteria bacterium]|nr:cytochrome c oxidase subunit II [Gammaproteobacteria bacterium]